MIEFNLAVFKSIPFECYCIRKSLYLVGNVPGAVSVHLGPVMRFSNNFFKFFIENASIIFEVTSSLPSLSCISLEVVRASGYSQATRYKILNVLFSEGS